MQPTEDIHYCTSRLDGGRSSCIQVDDHFMLNVTSDQLAVTQPVNYCPWCGAAAPLIEQKWKELTE